VLRDLLVALAGGAVTVIFTAGILWDQFRRMRRDLNGLGSKMNRLTKICLIYCRDEDRKEIGAMLNGDVR
jgi:hypothetical protein